jgi:hypothetical protein
VVDFCNEKGMQLEIKQELPRYFDYKVVHEEDNEDIAAVSQALKELGRKHGPL